MSTNLILLAALFLLPAGNICAQEQTPVSLSTILEIMPVPAPSLRAMMEDNTTNEVAEQHISSAFKAINKQVDLLYQPVYERFRKAMLNAGPLNLTPGEKTILTNVRSGAKGLTDASQYHFFKLQMGFRAPVGGGKPLWAPETPLAKSASAQKIYQQLKMAEGGFEWKSFFSTAEQYVLKFSSTNQHLEAINKKFNADLENLPKKKINLEGFTHETADPDKAIALCKKYGAERQQASEEEYATTYLWWSQQYKKLKAIIERTDALALELASMDVLSRRPLDTYLADLQIRSLEAMDKLTAVTQRMYNDRLIAIMGDKQIKEMMSVYTQYKAGA